MGHIGARLYPLTAVRRLAGRAALARFPADLRPAIVLESWHASPGVDFPDTFDHVSTRNPKFREQALTCTI